MKVVSSLFGIEGCIQRSEGHPAETLGIDLKDGETTQNAEPTTLRVAGSSTTARYSQPSR
jgi:hypothetical protein